jgi:hypothetical protein
MEFDFGYLKGSRLSERSEISAMSTNSKPVYMLRPSGDSIAINRTVKIIGDGDGPFVVLVTDRDYQDDPTGQSQTIVFRESYALIDDAAAEVGIFDGRLYS